MTTGTVLEIESAEPVLLDNDSITYDIYAVIEDASVTLPAVYNPPELAHPEAYGPGLCNAEVAIYNSDNIDPSQSIEFLSFIDNLNLDWTLCTEEKMSEFIN